MPFMQVTAGLEAVFIRTCQMCALQGPTQAAIWHAQQMVRHIQMSICLVGGNAGEQVR